MNFAFYDTKQYDRESFEKVAEKSGISFKFFEDKLSIDTAELSRGCEGVCIFVNDVCDAAVIDKLYELGVKVIALRCAGYNNVDVRHAFGKIHIFHVPAYSPYAIAEHAMAMLLTSIRRIHKAYIRTREFNFSLNGLAGFDLHGKTVGVVGTGRIGKAFANICRGFGMNVLAYDKFPDSELDVKYVSLFELIENSDIISLHCPLNKDTYHIIDSDTIEKMKKGIVIINTSRGALIDAQALLEGIKSRKIGAACLDVYEEEFDIFFEDFSGHIIDDDTLSLLISMPNVIVTSHQAFLTNEALQNIAQTTIDNINEFFENGYSKNELCYRCGKTADCGANGKPKKCF